MTGNSKPKGKRVVVAMSGGVDSSTVAAMLVEEGYDVVGITLQLYDHGQALKKKGACCAGQDIYDAKSVAERLNIPHYVLNYESRFKESVMDDFVKSYLAGETPIPCVRCNQTVKFHDLLKTARELGAEWMATGHYVRRIEGAGGAEMHQGIDPSKDQSYFLFATTREQLDFLRFPLGGLKKEETRALAQKYGIPVADKPDSQDICFVPNGDYASVIERLKPGAADPGEIVHADGRVLGAHKGVIHYTVGQRKGLGVSLPGDQNDPLYVLRIEPEARRVIVGPKEALLRNELTVHDINWLDADLPPEGVEAMVKLRSAQAPVAAMVLGNGKGGARVRLHEPVAGIAAGQACVAYRGSRVLGGGWIARPEVVG
ncbi:MAG: tRNA 2-thiouridine(34) synthase MnmA [Alphaproteobacteria bacterium]|nr:tRNA 2-thiouridine(34) synthase MnmA [Alphaproteobacteria bacterium]